MLSAFLNTAVVVFCVCWHESSSVDVGIGVLLESDEATEILQAFDVALAYAKTVITVSENVTYIKVTIDVTQSDAAAVQSACDLISKGVIMVLGPMTSRYADLLGWLFEQANVPIISPTATSPILSKYKYMFRVTGSDLIQGAALASLYTNMGWKRGNIITSADDYGVQGLISFQQKADFNGWRFPHITRVDRNTSDADIRGMLVTIRRTSYRVTILNMFANTAARVLKLASSLNMTGQGWSYLVTDGITTTSSFDHKTPLHLGLIGTTYTVGNGVYFDGFQAQFISTTGIIQISPAVYQVSDAVFAAMYSLKSVSTTSAGVLPPIIDITCNGAVGPTTWINGNIYRTALLGLAQNGVNSFIQFKSTTQEPEKFSLDLVNSQLPNGWEKIATYGPTVGYNLVTPTSKYVFPGGKNTILDYESPLKGQHFRLVTIVELPFIMLRKTPANLSNIEIHTEIEGYLVDLMQRLSEELGFTYHYYYVRDGQFGAKDEATGTWNGMAKELIDQRADIAAGSFTVTKGRLESFDFTTYYIDLGLLIGMTREDTSVSTFKFIEPFSYTVWGMILMSFVFVGCSIGFLEKVSPTGTHGEFIQMHHNMEYANQSRRHRKGFRREKKIALEYLSMPNALWFSWASLLQQGYHVLPQAMSGRFVTGAWWLIVVTFVSMYTAKLGSYLISSRLSTSINSLDDLVAQSDVKYGVTQFSSYTDVFCSSTIESYVKFCENMEVSETTQKGFERVSNSGGKYAFVWDSIVVESFAELMPCNIRAVGAIFNRLGLGLGLQHNSPIKEALSEEILALRAQGYMDELYQKWINDRSECLAAGIKPQVAGETESQYGVKHMLGVFIVIGAAGGLALLVLIIEWIVSSSRAVDTNIVYRPNTFCGGVAYRCGRMRNDFCVNFIPDKVSSHNNTRKAQAGLHEKRSKGYTRAMKPAGGDREYLNAVPPINRSSSATNMYKGITPNQPDSTHLTELADP